MQLRDLPSVDVLLHDARLTGEPRAATLAAVRAALALARVEIRAGRQPGDLVTVTDPDLAWSERLCLVQSRAWASDGSGRYTLRVQEG